MNWVGLGRPTVTRTPCVVAGMVPLFTTWPSPGSSAPATGGAATYSASHVQGSAQPFSTALAWTAA